MYDFPQIVRVSSTADFPKVVRIVVPGTVGPQGPGMPIFNTDPSGQSDVSSAFSDFLAAHEGQKVAIEGGTYGIAFPIIWPPNTPILAIGNVTLKKIGTAWETAPLKVMMHNPNHDATVITDENFVIEGVNFDWDDIVSGACHSLYLRMCRFVRVINCKFNRGGNGSSLLACEDTVVDGCRAINVSNCGFDHWDGARSASVVNSFVNAPQAGQGIQFTGSATAGIGNSEDFAAIGNRVYNVNKNNAVVGIAITNVDIGASALSVRIADNYVKAVGLGIALQGNAGGIIKGNIIEGAINSSIALVKYGTDASQDGSIIADNQIKNPLSTGGTAPIYIQSGARHLVAGNTFLANGANINVKLDTETSDCLVDVYNAPDGLAGAVSDFGTNNIVHRRKSQPYTPVLSFGGASTGITYSTQTGSYIVIDDFCYFRINLVLTSKGSAVGVAGVTMPFVPTEDSGNVVNLAANFVGTPGVIVLGVRASQFIAIFRKAVAGGLANMTDADFAQTTNLNVAGSFKFAGTP